MVYKGYNIHTSLTKFGPVPYGVWPAMCFYLSLMPKCLLRVQAKLPPSYTVGQIQSPQKIRKTKQHFILPKVLDRNQTSNNMWNQIWTKKFTLTIKNKIFKLRWLFIIKKMTRYEISFSKQDIFSNYKSEFWYYVIIKYFYFYKSIQQYVC